MTIEEQPEQFNNTRKADFKSIYNQSDPRAYFAALTTLQYQIPQLALPFVNRILQHISSRAPSASPSGTTSNDDDTVTTAIKVKVLDVCSSYGINAALLRHDIDMDGLAEHYVSTPKPSSREQIEADERFFAGRRLQTEQDSENEVEIIGLDVAPEAISYSLQTGLHAAAFTENLETSNPSPDLRNALRDVKLVVCTGGVGYVGASTFSRIAAAARPSSSSPSELWMVTFVLRVFSFDEVAERLRTKFGLVTDKVEGRVFRQRRFSSREEQRAAVEDVRRKGLDERGLEGDGWFCAECWVTRPESWRGEVGELVEGL
ncbi:hypothetical protein BDP81DRAFT_456184 [Colletotrichum phormii]|uniref:Uncharacterized protein n=1 Tax=Colletotrichum phormii TaxID=359342 RepID=A0AAI9ZD97_9PEZI|nr:uncharacterized protein BDP81DRAFT_456184 [Colletotrichum phormii]KAK1621490.1 hypothetical protein BDP81DRAFT_456184 [Colletotrichum phormii]